MTQESISSTTKKALIPIIINKLWPIFIGIVISGSAYFYSLGSEIITDPGYPKYSLGLLAILLCTTILFLVLWARLYWHYARFRAAYGVLWDRYYNMHCPSCHKSLKPASDPTKPFLFYCSDIKCNNKCPLRTDEGKMITQKEAIELLKKESLKG
jgi:hypothetical protein